MCRPEASVLRRRVAANVHRLRLEVGMTLPVASERAEFDLRHWQKREAIETNLTSGPWRSLRAGSAST